MSKSENKVAGYSIIGFDNIGQALAKAFAHNGIEVSVATKRDPKSFASEAENYRIFTPNNYCSDLSSRLPYLYT